jgi:hypothetical protein
MRLLPLSAVSFQITLKTAPRYRKRAAQKAGQPSSMERTTASLHGLPAAGA